MAMFCLRDKNRGENNLIQNNILQICLIEIWKISISELPVTPALGFQKKTAILQTKLIESIQPKTTSYFLKHLGLSPAKYSQISPK